MGDDDKTADIETGHCLNCPPSNWQIIKLHRKCCKQYSNVTNYMYFLYVFFCKTKCHDFYPHKVTYYASRSGKNKYFRQKKKKKKKKNFSKKKKKKKKKKKS